MGCDAVGWQGATTLRAYAREEKQRSQRAAARLNRVRSALTQPVKVVVRRQVSIHVVYPAEESGQLPFLVPKRMSFNVSCKDFNAQQP